MNNNSPSYWLYLEPYTFIFKGEENYLVYNTLNAAYLLYNDRNIIALLDKLSDPDNGYIIPIEKNIADNRNVVNFVRDLRRSFSGDILSPKSVSEEHKPFIFMPLLRLYNNIDRIKEERGQSLGEVILRNLSEVTFNMPNSCSHSCLQCGLYHKQFIHCTKTMESDTILHLENYTNLFKQLEACGVNQVNFVITSLPDELKILPELLRNYTFKKDFYIHLNNLENNLFLLSDESIKVHVSVGLHGADFDKIAKKINEYKGKSIIWELIVEEETDLTTTDKISFVNYKFRPFYNGQNGTFFETFVYTDKEDLIECAISKKQIFRRQVLNENFFGKLYISMTGEAYANLNQPALGNVKTHSLGEIIYKELEDSHAWLRVRNGKICGKCVNRYLCPSISNYELVMNIENMCHIIK